MKARTAKQASWVLIAVTLLVAGVGIWKFRDLQQTVEEQRRWQASAQAAQVYIEDALPAFLDFRNAVSALCRDAEAGASTQEFCENWRHDFAVFEPHLNALTFRALAVRTGDYRRARESYEQLVAYLRRLPADGGWRDGWLARAYEGIAYADYKSGDLLSARRNIDMAVQFDRGTEERSAFVGTTELKISCSEGLPAPHVRGRYGALIAALKERIRKSRQTAPRSEQAKLEARNADFELRRVHDDDELYLVCAAAGLDREAAESDR